MSLEYSLPLRNKEEVLDASRVTAFLGSCAGLEEGRTGPDSFTGRGLWVNVLSPDEYESDPPDVRISFTVDKFNIETAQDEMLRVVLLIAAGLPGGGVLSFQGEREILRIQGGSVEICESDFWTEERRKQVAAWERPLRSE